MRICVDTQVSVASLLDGFDLFCSCDLDLDPMTFIYKLDPYSLEIHRMCKYELCMSRLSIVIVWQTCRHTDRQNRPQNKPQRFAGGQKYKTQCYLHSIMGVGWNAIVQCWLRHCSRRQTDRQTLCLVLCSVSRAKPRWKLSVKIQFVPSLLPRCCWSNCNTRQRQPVSGGR